MVEKVKKDVIYNRYLEYFLNSPYAREQAQKRTRGTANRNLVINEIKQITIRYPNTTIAQEEIVKELDVLSEEINLLLSRYLHKIERLDLFKQSLLQQAFNGEL